MAEKNEQPGRGGRPRRRWPLGRLARRHPVISAAAAFIGVGLVIFGLVWFQPQKLFLNKTVNEPVPGVIQTAPAGETSHNPAAGRLRRQRQPAALLPLRPAPTATWAWRSRDASQRLLTRRPCLDDPGYRLVDGLVEAEFLRLEPLPAEDDQPRADERGGGTDDRVPAGKPAQRTAPARPPAAAGLLVLLSHRTPLGTHIQWAPGRSEAR